MPFANPLGHGDVARLSTLRDVLELTLRSNEVVNGSSPFGHETA